MNLVSVASGESGASAPKLTVYLEAAGEEYSVTVGMVKFNTGAVIPDAATIQGATLKLSLNQRLNTDSAEMGIEYYGAGNWPIDSGDWTSTPADSAYSFVPLSSLSLSGARTWNSFPLKSAAANISKTGQTGFRIHVKTTPTTPTGGNRVRFDSQESAFDPVLEVTYTPTQMIEGTFEDAASIAAHGLFSRSIVDPRIISQAEAEQIAEGEVLRYAWPQHSVRASTDVPGLTVGRAVQIVAPSIGIDGLFLIRQLSMRSPAPRRMRYTIDAGDFRLDLIRYFRRMSQ